MRGTATLSVEKYLSTSFEWEPEYLHGELVERPMPNFIHGFIIALLAIRLRPYGYPSAGVRLRIASDLVRIPDLSFFVGTQPEARYPAEPPFATVEIISDDDRYRDVMDKCEEYRGWGVPNIWVIDPDLRKFYVYSAGLSERDEFELPGLGFTITARSLFDEVFSGR